MQITLEQGAVQAPTGRVVLAAAFPPGAFTHVKHLMLAFPTTPQQRGLLVGLLQQVQVLDQQAQVLQSFAQRGYWVSIKCPAQNIVNIIEGAHGQHYKALGPDCAARNISQADDGYGLLGADGYLAGVADHASLAANAADAPSDMHLHAGHVQICVTNVTGWVTTIEQDALAVLNGSQDQAKAKEIATLGDLALHGHDLDGDESTDPVPGEGGVVTAYDHGLLMGSLTLVATKS
jgi:hypothetical protein